MADATRDAPPAASAPWSAALPPQRLAQWAAIGIGGGTVFAALLSYAAPCGIWTNRVLGQDFWFENDPGGWYLGSAHELALGSGPPFPGHPGTPLQLALWCVQRIGYALAAPRGADFAEFTARHLAAVGFASKLVVSAAHLAAIALLYLFARRLLRDRGAAIVATLLYATSFPLLFYFSRISAEPFAIGCLLATLLAAGRARDDLLRSRRAAALGFAALAALAAVTGVFSKLVLCLPLPLVGLACALTPTAGAPPVRWRRRLELAAVYTGGALAGAALLSPFVDWGQFFGLWRQVIESEAAAAPALGIGSGPVAGVLRRSAGFPWRSYLPGAIQHAWNSVFLCCEWLLLIGAGAGAIQFLRRERGRRRELLWPGVMVAYTIPCWLANWSFHYLFFAICIGSATAGYLLTLPRRGAPGLLSGSRALVLAGSGLLLVHGLSLYAVVDSRLADVRAFRQSVLPYQRALELAGDAGVVAVVHRGAPPELPTASGISPLSMYTWRPSRLAAAFERLFWCADATVLSPEEIERELLARGIRVVIDAAPGRAPELVTLVRAGKR
ncbi:MAG: hypothetical protein JXR83_10760 [Deltaproteobacteria bacterium]|nr:hypothetical protein [Deltaproteobacteria bacterium]